MIGYNFLQPRYLPRKVSRHKNRDNFFELPMKLLSVDGPPRLLASVWEAGGGAVSKTDNSKMNWTIIKYRAPIRDVAKQRRRRIAD